MFKKLLFAGALASVFSAKSQDMTYTSQVLDKLTSVELAGRGYVENGHLKAATYIASEFEKAGLKKFEKTYFQNFSLEANIFPGAMEVQLQKDIALKPGVDYIVGANSPSLKGCFNLVLIDSSVVADEKKIKKMRQMDYTNEFIILDDSKVVLPEQKEFFKFFLQESWGAKGLILISDNKLTADIASTQGTTLVLHITRKAMQAANKVICVNIESEIAKVKTQNVVGYVSGTQYPDSFVVISAHYDHLGKMGTATYFPGASDNASGTSMLLNLAQYYAKNPAKYSVVFMAFSGEEIGLLGSMHYVENPLFPLKKIKFLFNIDIMGDAADGITLVNGTVMTAEYNKITAINDAKKYIPSIQKRGEAAISDHYPFYTKGVSCFFAYSRGKITAYHDVNDTKAGLPLTNYQGCFQLFKDFIAAL
ncbi:MAG: M28 family metallopeptidase [Flavobacteriales bacterium]